MLSNYVMPGDRVELEDVRSRKNREEQETAKKIYKSQVHDILSEERVEITMPLDKAKLQLLPVDMEYAVYFFTSNGVFRCMARVAERYKSGNIYLLAMELTSNLSKQQRREYYRYECALELRVRVLKEQEIEAVKQKKNDFLQELPVQKGVIVDISGGGIRFVTGTVFEPESLLYLDFSLVLGGTGKTFRVAGRLLTTKGIENKPGLYENRIQFLNMDPREREEIIKFIFEQERRQRKREKG